MTRNWVSDVTLQEIGGYCIELGLWWRLDLTTEHCSRTTGAAGVEPHNVLNMDVLVDGNGVQSMGSNRDSG